MKRVGGILKKYREEAGFTLNDVEEILQVVSKKLDSQRGKFAKDDLAISRATISRIETGESNGASYRPIMYMCDLYKIPFMLKHQIHVESGHHNRFILPKTKEIKEILDEAASLMLADFPYPAYICDFRTGIWAFNYFALFVAQYFLGSNVPIFNSYTSELQLIFDTDTIGQTAFAHIHVQLVQHQIVRIKSRTQMFPYQYVSDVMKNYMREVLPSSSRAFDNFAANWELYDISNANQKRNSWPYERGGYTISTNVKENSPILRFTLLEAPITLLANNFYAVYYIPADAYTLQEYEKFRHGTVQGVKKSWEDWQADPKYPNEVQPFDFSEIELELRREAQ